MDIFAKCYNFTAAREAQAAGYYPYFIPIEGSNDTEVMINGKKLIMIGSNNYMGLTHHPKVIQAAKKAIDKYGSGCTGSRFLNGTLDLHEKLEAELAKFVNKEAALVFSTGYQVNLGVISALVGKSDVVIMDKLNHASIVDGAKMSFGETLRFRHRDLSDLTNLLKKIEPKRGKLIVVDGIFSMEGDIADIPSLIEICRQFNCRLMIDDAHAMGVIGETGAGTAEHFGVSDQVDLIMGTFSKSFASIGGFIAADSQVIDYLKHHARSLIFSASMPPSAVATVLAALEIIKTEPERRERLWKSANKVREELKNIGFDTGTSETPIIPVVFGDNMTTFIFWRNLFDEGVFTNPVVSPAVPENMARLRTSYIATHTDEQLDFVIEKFAKVGKKLGVI